MLRGFRTGIFTAAALLIFLAASAALAQTSYLLTVSKSGGSPGTVASSPAGINCGSTCSSASAYFASGSVVTLTATGVTGASIFNGWSGGGCSGTGTCVVTLGAATTVTASFLQASTLTVVKSGTGTGTVTSSPAGINCGPTCASASADFLFDFYAVLTATPSSGSTFVGWSGGNCSGTGTCTVPIVGAVTVVATFTTSMPPGLVLLTVLKTGTGFGTVDSSPAGISCGTTCVTAATSFATGTTVTLTAAAASGSSFGGWSGGGCSGTGTCTVTLNSETAVTATFAPAAPTTYTLAVAKTGSGSGSVQSSPSGISCGTACTGAATSFAAGTVVMLLGTADPGSSFDGWSGGGCSGTRTCSVTLNAATAVTASFTLTVPTTYALTVAKSGTGSGTVTSSPAGISCGTACTGAVTSFTAGTAVTLSAAAASGSSFAGWSGGGCSGTGACTVTLNAATTVTATFTATAPSTFTVTIVKSGTGKGTVTLEPGGIACAENCTGASATYAAGTAVTLTASPAGTSTFAGWSGGACVGTGSCTFTLTAARTITATFSAIPLAAPVFPMTVTASIGPTVASATASLQFRPEDVGTAGSVYTFAMAPAALVKGASVPKDDLATCVLAQLSPGGQLQAASPEQLQAALSGNLTALGLTVSVMNNVPTAAVAGATFYVGYGSSSTDMLIGGLFRQAVTVPGAATCPMFSSQTALWWNPAENGWGINLNHQGNVLFGTLFTYDANRTPLWLVMSRGLRQADGLTFTGDLFQTQGSPFNADPFTPIGAGDITKVGSMTVSFQDVNSAALRYTMNGVEVAKAIQRQVFGTRAAACFPTTASQDSSTNYQDLWWNPSESGWGINITHQGDTLFATLFTYDATGRGLWLVMSSGERQADGSYQGTLYRTSGPAFSAQPFTPIGGADIATVGTMGLRFADGLNGTLTYTYGGATVTKAITRQVFGTTVPVCY